MKRGSGVLLPVASLPSKYGIGCFSKEAYDFVDKLEEAGQSYWQILPLSPTGYGDSPYQSCSSFAGNPYFIDLETLIAEGVLTKKECDACDFGDDPTKVDYGKIYEERLELLRLAFERSKVEKDREYQKFVKEEAYWLDSFALFMGIKKRFDGAAWSEWAEDIRKRWDFAMVYYNEHCVEEMNFQKYLQYQFRKQWLKLKKYANDKGISIIGDIPIYAAFDSSDAWANPELFQFDSELRPISVAGCPPDAFAADGQLWGNPLYRWDYHKQTGYEWWCKRLEHCFKLYDVVRIDHFRGFDEYYSIPFGDKTARGGHWEKGPGIDLFRTLNQRLGEKQIVAEDLGFLTESVKQLLKDSGYPGMKVLEFAFVPGEDSVFLPHNYDRNYVVYTGTHDNETLVQWYGGLDKETKAYILEYMDKTGTPEKNRHWDFIRLAMMSTADTCITPIQDFLGLGKEGRINHPSTLGGNWQWRMSQGMFTEELVQKIYALTKVSFRLSQRKITEEQNEIYIRKTGLEKL